MSFKFLTENVDEKTSDELVRSFQIKGRSPINWPQLALLNFSEVDLIMNSWKGQFSIVATAPYKWSTSCPLNFWLRWLLLSITFKIKWRLPIIEVTHGLTNFITSTFTIFDLKCETDFTLFEKKYRLIFS